MGKAYLKKHSSIIVIFILILITIIIFLTIHNYKSAAETSAAPTSTPTLTAASTPVPTSALTTTPELNPAPTSELTPALTPSLSYKAHVNHSSAYSPDGKFLAETYGAYTDITAGGLYPAEGIRIVELSSDQTLWKMQGYYGTDFLWSSDSRYLAVYYMARIYGCTVIIDTTDFSEIQVPLPNELQSDMQEFRPDPYIKASEWIDNETILITFEYIDTDYNQISGTLTFVPITGEIYDITINEIN